MTLLSGIGGMCLYWRMNNDTPKTKLHLICVVVDCTIDLYTEEKMMSETNEYKNCHCENGRLVTECCSGSNCYCRGDTVDLGICRVCNGTGIRAETSTGRENIDYISGLGGYLMPSLNGDKRIGE